MTRPLHPGSCRPHPLVSLPLLLAAFAVLIVATPAQAQRCFTQNGQTICCDNSGNCYSR